MYHFSYLSKKDLRSAILSMCMSKSDSSNRPSSIPVTGETRQLVKRQKRGGESYDSLLRKMVDQYDPGATEQ